MKNRNHKMRKIMALLVFLICVCISADPADAQLGWSSKQSTTWQRMYSENHPMWQTLKAQADRSGIYNDDGLRDGMVYLITGDSYYAQKAWDHVDYWAGRTKPGVEPYNRNTTRVWFGRMAILYDWISPALSAQDRADFRDILDHWADLCFNIPNPDVPGSSVPNWGTRVSDSDETVGHYFGVILYALAIQDEDPARSQELLNFSGGSEKPVGGLDYVGPGYSTWRRGISLYGERAAGGQWMEGSQYNLFTVRMAVMYTEAVNDFLGQNKFPEITALYDHFADSLVQELTPDMDDTYQWGDIQEPHDLMLYYRLALMSTLAGVTDNPQAWYAFDDFYSSYTSIPDGNFLPFYDPYVTRQRPTGITSQNAHGRGIAFFHSGWEWDDSFFGSRMANFVGVDHEMESLSNFQLYRKGNWVISNPRGYYGGEYDALYSNTLIVNGGLASTKEARGQVAYEAGDHYMYHVGVTGGQFYEQGYWSPPPEALHEWTRSNLYIHHDNADDTIIVFDRVNSDNPLTLSSFDRYRTLTKDRINGAGGKHLWIMHLPTDAVTFQGNEALWTAEGGEQISLITYLSSPYDRTVYDEKVLYSEGKLGGYMDDTELKYQMRIVPTEDDGFQTFLNILHLGDTISTTQLVSTSGEQAKGIKLQSTGQDVVVFFNGSYSEPPDPTPLDIYGKSVHDPQKFSQLSQLHYFTTGYTANISVSEPTEVFLADLNPALQWTLLLNGNEISTAVSQQGLAHFVVNNIGVNTISVSSDGNPGNRSPVAIIDIPVQTSALTAYFEDASYDPDGDTVTYSWNFGDGQTSTQQNPTHTYGQDGTYSVQLTVDDGELSSTDVVSVTVSTTASNNLPNISVVGDTTQEEGGTISLVIAAADSDGDAISLSAQLSDGQTVESIGATFVDAGSGNGMFSWTTGVGQAGQYQVVFQASDGTGSSTTTVTLIITQGTTSSDYAVMVSYSADRRSAFELANSIEQQNIYVFTSPDDAVTRVSFYLDDAAMSGEPIKVENYGPFDFAGTLSTGNAYPYDAGQLSDGNHTITAKIRLSDGSDEVVTSIFTIGSVSAVCGNGVVEQQEQCDDGDVLSGDGCSSVCIVEFCGDGIVHANLSEECDDGNNSSQDGCSAQCLDEYCGDSIVQAGLGETCDDGNTTSLDGCSSECLLEYCGDGVVQSALGEACDDGNSASGDGCSSSCQEESAQEVCGNGICADTEDYASCPADCPAPPSNSDYTVMLSYNQNRSNARPLASNIDETNIFLFTQPETNVKKVDFYLNDPDMQGAAMKTESYAPYDFAGTLSTGDAYPYDARLLADGYHTVTAVVTLADGSQEIVHAPFVKGNLPAVCGNSIVEDQEECDDGNSINGDGCSSDCAIEALPAECGNGLIEDAEQCDDGNIISNDGCSAVCVVEYCGDGILHAGLNEECDDGNTADNDGCSATCSIESQPTVCGDGVLDTNEACDDGNNVSGDGCSQYCVTEYCGDNILQSTLGEQCDDGNNADNDGCSAVCVAEYCGDGIIQSALLEECDDSNTTDGDGCSAVCVIEPEPEICGNGVCAEEEDYTNCPADCEAPVQTGYDVMFSYASNRSNPIVLGGEVEPSNIYVFVAPEENIKRVKFYLDDPARITTPSKIENVAPYDFAGTLNTGNAYPYDAGLLAEGAHSITVAISLDDGSEEVATGYFTVVYPPTCGDNMCEEGESYESCPWDCKPPVQETEYNLILSYSADRSEGTLLEGFVQDRSIYVFVAPEDGIVSVEFYLDDTARSGAPIKTEGLAPYDFAGTVYDGDAYPYDARRFSTGSHTITAVISLDNGNEKVITASFYVQ